MMSALLAYGYLIKNYLLMQPFKAQIWPCVLGDSLKKGGKSYIGGKINQWLSDPDSNLEKIGRNTLFELS